MTTAIGEQQGPDSPDVLLAKIGKKFERFEKLGAVPADADVVTTQDLTEMSKDQLESFYADLVGMTPKKFKDKKMVLSSITSQVEKMPFFDPSKIKEAKPAKGDDKRRYERKAPNTYCLLPMPPDGEKTLSSLAPQAKECVRILADFALESGKSQWSEEELKKRFEKEGDRLRTKQSPWRILQYYRSKLININLLRVQ